MEDIGFPGPLDFYILLFLWDTTLRVELWAVLSGVTKKRKRFRVDFSRFSVKHFIETFFLLMNLLGNGAITLLS